MESSISKEEVHLDFIWRAMKTQTQDGIPRVSYSIYKNYFTVHKNLEKKKTTLKVRGKEDKLCT